MPKLNDRLLSVPSRFDSPLPRLCFALYEVRSASVKPSCAVMKFTLASGPRSREKCQAEPDSSFASAPIPVRARPPLRVTTVSVSQKSRTVSR